jgi:hypothetical protein
VGTIIFHRDELDLIAELAGCSLDEKPGSNWVQEAGGLPGYICEIAKDIHEERGKTVSQAIAIAVSRVKVWAAGGDNVDAKTRAKAAKAVAEWEALKGKNEAKKGAKKAERTVAASHTDPVTGTASRASRASLDKVVRLANPNRAAVDSLLSAREAARR